MSIDEMSIAQMYDLSGEVAVVTGAGRGIGEGIATILAEAGAAVVLAARHAVEMPIAQSVRQVLDGELEPREAVEKLLSRQLRNENE